MSSLATTWLEPIRGPREGGDWEIGEDFLAPANDPSTGNEQRSTWNPERKTIVLHKARNLMPDRPSGKPWESSHWHVREWSALRFDEDALNAADKANLWLLDLSKKEICFNDLASAYDIASFNCPKRTSESAEPAKASKTLEDEFNELADKWYRDTRKLSVADQIVTHPAYQKIIGMGRDALPFIFRELKRTRGHWLWALQMICRHDHAKPGQKFGEAVDHWLKWGEGEGYI